MAICSHSPYGAHRGLYPRRPRLATLTVAPQGGPLHPRGPDPTQHLDEPDPPSPVGTRPGQGHETRSPTVPDDQGTPEAGGTHHQLSEPARAAPRQGAPIQSTAETPPTVRPAAARRRRSACPRNRNWPTTPLDTETTTGVQGTGGRPEPQSHTGLSSKTDDLRR